MTAVIYPSAKKLFLDGDLDLLVDTIKVALVDTGVYTYSSAHDFYNDVSAGVVGTPGTLDNKTTTAGVFDADDEVLTSVSGATVEAVLIYKDTGNPATSPVIAFVDDLTLTPNGDNVTVRFNASGIFAI